MPIRCQLAIVTCTFCVHCLCLQMSPCFCRRPFWVCLYACVTEWVKCDTAPQLSGHSARPLVSNHTLFPRSVWSAARFSGEQRHRAVGGANSSQPRDGPSLGCGTQLSGLVNVSGVPEVGGIPPAGLGGRVCLEVGRGRGKTRMGACRRKWGWCQKYPASEG